MFSHSPIKFNQSGVTLVELVVGLALAGLVVMVGGNVLNQVTSNIAIAERDGNFDRETEYIGNTIIAYLKSIKDPAPILTNCETVGVVSYCRRMSFLTSHKSSTPYRVIVESSCLPNNTTGRDLEKKPICFPEVCEKGYRLTINKDGVTKNYGDLGENLGYSASVCFIKSDKTYQVDVKMYHAPKKGALAEFGRIFNMDQTSLYGAELIEYIR